MKIIVITLGLIFSMFSPFSNATDQSLKKLKFKTVWTMTVTENEGKLKLIDLSEKQEKIYFKDNWLCIVTKDVELYIEKAGTMFSRQIICSNHVLGIINSSLASCYLAEPKCSTNLKLKYGKSEIAIGISGAFFEKIN